MVKLYLMNSPIMVFEGESAVFRAEKISPEEARRIFNSFNPENIISAIGHEATAKALSVILGAEVKVNRVMVSFDFGDMAIVFRLKQRLPEGRVIKSIEELSEIGYELMLVTRVV